MTGAGAAVWLSIGSPSARASEREAATLAQAGVGTLPLLAAMGIGIVVAALAVIAFLQMTTKARNGRDAGAEAPDSAEASDAEESSASVPDNGLESAEPDDRAADLELPLPDYTIPLPAVRPCSEAASPAEEGTPRLWGVEGEFAGSGFKVSSCWLTLGRDVSQCGLIFPYDAGEVSRKHCSLKYEEDRGLFLLEDHHSSNGTYLSGGERLEPGIVYELPPGSRFFLSGGKHGFEVQI